MTPTSRKQILAMIRTWCDAGDVREFDIGALDHGSERMTLRGPWSLDQVTRALGWLAARNAAGSSIYARPARTLPAHPWILVDDLDADGLAILDELAPAGLVVETSPGSMQAWVRMYQPYPDPIRTAIARHLAHTVGGDPAAVGGSQFGRLPGTTNRKLSRRGSDGMFPFARLRRVDPDPATKLDDLELAELDIPEQPDQAPVQAAPVSGRYPSPAARPPRRSRSERDFALACRMAEAGESDEAIKRAIAAVRDDAKADRSDYLARTVSAARTRVHGRNAAP